MRPIGRERSTEGLFERLELRAIVIRLLTRERRDRRQESVSRITLRLGCRKLRRHGHPPTCLDRCPDSASLLGLRQSLTSALACRGTRVAPHASMARACSRVRTRAYIFSDVLDYERGPRRRRP